MNLSSLAVFSAYPLAGSFEMAGVAGHGQRKIILSAKGDKDDVSEELKSFLAYVAGKAPGSDFTQRLDALIEKARAHIEWRKEYMTLLERDERMREEGRAEGEQKLANLVSRLIADGKAADVERVASDKEYRDSLYKQYALMTNGASEGR